MTSRVVLGVDSSTQSTKVLAIDLESAAVLAEGRAPHTGLDTQDPVDWWSALRNAIRQLPLDQFEVAAISVAGQQHGCVTLDVAGRPVRPAPLWNNVDAAPDADRLNRLADFAAETGSRLVASITIAKLAYLARTAPGDLAKTASVCLPHDYFNFRLTGELTTDRGEASGSGWFSLDGNTIRRDLIALATCDDDAARLRFPRVIQPVESAGALSRLAASELGLQPGIPVGPGTGDNMAAALGLAATPGEFVVSLGTSGTVYMVSPVGSHDSSGEVSGFADAAGQFLPLVCMLNCTRVVDAVAGLLGMSRDDALHRAGLQQPGAAGLRFMPYLAGERTPNLPAARGSVHGISMENLTADQLCRAAVDGVAAGLAYCMDALRRQGLDAPKVLLTGGGSVHPTWQQAIADAVQLPVTVRGGSEHVARGAAVQAAAMIRGQPVAQMAKEWRPPVTVAVEPRRFDGDPFFLVQREEWIAAMRTEFA